MDVLLLPGISNWKLRERAIGEPLIWHDTPWIVGTDLDAAADTAAPFVEDVLWRELDPDFPGQLNALQVGK